MSTVGFRKRHSLFQHSMMRGLEIVGLTEVGRATVRLLDMNAKHRLQLREKLQALGDLDKLS